MDVVIYGEPQNEEIKRAVILTNDEWLVVSQCVEAFSEKIRASHSQIIATLVTRNQLEEAKSEAKRMNLFLQQLDKVQASLF